MIDRPVKALFDLIQHAAPLVLCSMLKSGTVRIRNIVPTVQADTRTATIETCLMERSPSTASVLSAVPTYSTKCGRLLSVDHHLSHWQPPGGALSNHGA